MAVLLTPDTITPWERYGPSASFLCAFRHFFCSVARCLVCNRPSRRPSRRATAVCPRAITRSPFAPPWPALVAFLGIGATVLIRAAHRFALDPGYSKKKRRRMCARALAVYNEPPPPKKEKKGKKVQIYGSIYGQMYGQICGPRTWTCTFTYPHTRLDMRKQEDAGRSASEGQAKYQPRTARQPRRQSRRALAHSGRGLLQAASPCC
jgi:hypothetical protein